MIPLLFGKVLLDFFAKHTKAFAVIITLILWFIGIIQSCIINTLAALSSGLNSLDLSPFKNTNFGSLPWMAEVNAFIPLSEFITLFTLYSTAWGLVILFRWFKSLIPAWSN